MYLNNRLLGLGRWRARRLRHTACALRPRRGGAWVRASSHALPRGGLCRGSEDGPEPFQSVRELLFPSRVFHCKLIVPGLCCLSDWNSLGSFPTQMLGSPQSRSWHSRSSRRPSPARERFRSRAPRPGAGTSPLGQAVPALCASVSVRRKYRRPCSPPLGRSPRRRADAVWFGGTRSAVCGPGVE